jgi:hypothetical protein
MFVKISFGCFATVMVQNPHAGAKQKNKEIAYTYLYTFC